MQVSAKRDTSPICFNGLVIRDGLTRVRRATEASTAANGPDAELLLLPCQVRLMYLKLVRSMRASRLRQSGRCVCQACACHLISQAPHALYA